MKTVAAEIRGAQGGGSRPCQGAPTSWPRARRCEAPRARSSTPSSPRRASTSSTSSRSPPKRRSQQAVEGVRLARSLAPEVEFSAEDASRTDYGYLREVLQAVFEAGATTLNVPDTVGYSLPNEYADMVRKLVARHPGRRHLRPLPQRPRPRGGELASPPSRRARGRSSAPINGIGERAGNTVARGARDGAQGARARRSGRDRRQRGAARAHERHALRRSPASGRSPTRRSWAATRSPTRPASTSTASWPTRSAYEIMTPASVGVRETAARARQALGQARGRRRASSTSGSACRRTSSRRSRRG